MTPPGPRLLAATVLVLLLKAAAHGQEEVELIGAL
jgi:hypothetical protein